jgi:5'-nucleotidase / UDP-sugar diphosphatase
MDTNSSRHRLGIRLLALVLLLTTAAGCAGSPARGETATLLLIHTNDLHSQLLPLPSGEGGLARIGGYVERERSRRADVLFLDAGDAVTGTKVSSTFEGRPAFHVMSAMGYDAMTLGNHEFDHGFLRIEEYRRIATFPLLAANVRGPDGELLADAAWTIFPVPGLRVAVIGLLGPGTVARAGPERTAGCEFLPAAETLRALLPQVEAAADVVVVLSHLGIEGDRALAAEVPGIDVIVGGHSHLELLVPEKIGETLIVQALKSGRRIGRLELDVDRKTGRIISAEGSLVVVDAHLPPAQAVVDAVAVWEAAEESLPQGR